ncbi:MAG: CoA transferase [Burkholderiales bacterium]|nr:CoA transferase [Burkholderiales bacterium]
MSAYKHTATGEGCAALHGLKVLSLSHVVAGPLAAGLLADLGAEVVHVEQPGVGDPARYMGLDRDGVHVWWKVSGRNKRSVTLDLRKPDGAAIARDLAAWADLVITSVRPSTLRKWGLDWERLHPRNRKLIMLHITGFGLTGPRSDEAGFGKVGEAMSGVVNITGYADKPPLHCGFSHGDATTGLMGAFGLMAALYRRDHDPDFDGEVIDLALFESLFRLIEWQVIAHDQIDRDIQRNGNRLVFSPAAVANVYQSADGQYLTVTSGTPRSVIKIVALIGLRPDEYQTPAAQRERADILDQCLRDWVRSRSADEALSRMKEAGVVASRIYGIRDIMADDQYAAREDIVSVHDDDLGPIKMQGVIPKLVRHGGEVWRSGARLGADNELVFKQWLGMSEERFAALRADGTI